MAELTRRDLLARADLLAGAIALGRSELADAAPDLRDWRSVGAQFSLDPDRIHLASFLLAAYPRQVRQAIERHRRRLDANPVDYLHANGGSRNSSYAESLTAARRFGTAA